MTLNCDPSHRYSEPRGAEGSNFHFRVPLEGHSVHGGDGGRECGGGGEGGGIPAAVKADRAA